MNERWTKMIRSSVACCIALVAVGLVGAAVVGCGRRGPAVEMVEGIVRPRGRLAGGGAHRRRRSISSECGGRCEVRGRHEDRRLRGHRHQAGSRSGASAGPGQAALGAAERQGVGCAPRGLQARHHDASACHGQEGQEHVSFRTRFVGSRQPEKVTRIRRGSEVNSRWRVNSMELRGCGA